MATVAYPHIELRDGNMPYVSGTQTKVIEIALDRLTFGWDADEIHRQHPHLGLPQIYSALAYYYDHKAELDAVIEARRRRGDELRAEMDSKSVRAKLAAQGLLP